jgi:hypothetical protein
MPNYGILIKEQYMKSYLNGSNVIGYSCLYGVVAGILVHIHSYGAATLLLTAWSAHIAKMIVMGYRD